MQFSKHPSLQRVTFFFSFLFKVTKSQRGLLGLCRNHEAHSIFQVLFFSSTSLVLNKPFRFMYFFFFTSSVIGRRVLLSHPGNLVKKKLGQILSIVTNMAIFLLHYCVRNCFPLPPSFFLLLYSLFPEFSFVSSFFSLSPCFYSCK